VGESVIGRLYESAVENHSLLTVAGNRVDGVGGVDLDEPVVSVLIIVYLLGHDDRSIKVIWYARSGKSG
jgi:hypothetical protein